LSESVAVIVNDDVISTFDVRQRASLLLISAGMTSTPELMERARAQALSDLVDERLQLQEAESFDISVAPAEIDRRIADIARSNNVGADQLGQQLAQAGVSVSTLRSQIQADIAWSRLMRGLYGSRVRVSDHEVRETQERIAAGATRPQFLISEIFLPAETEQEFTEMQSGAMRLLEQMQRGAPFPMVARQFSASPSAAAGGDIGWIAQTELAPEVQPIAERLQSGQVSLPVRTSTGVYIIAMRDRREGAAAGATSLVTLRQVSAPAARGSSLERIARRIENCADIDGDIAEIDGAEIVDLGTTSEADLSPEIRTRIAGVPNGASTALQEANGRASVLFVCSRQTGGGGVPSVDEISDRLFEQEMTMLSERYLRNLRREATIIQR
jgi:peptidyl-prolyl cis-trans isomerase SurA